MKKIIFIAFTLFAIFLSSCTSNNDIEITEHKDLSINEYTSFLNKIDSINSLYTPKSHTLKAGGLLNYVLKNKAEKVADTGGNVVGGWIGKYLGTAVGTAMANPVVAASGYVIGRSVGRTVGGILASYACKLFIDYHMSHNNILKVPYQLEANSSIKDSIPYYIPEKQNLTTEDSLGYIHNHIIDSLECNKEEYMANGGINYDLLYLRCVKYAKCYGVDCDSITNNEEFKQAIIRYCKEISNLACKAENEEITFSQYGEGATNLLKAHGISEEIVSLFNDYILKVADTSEQLSEEQQKQYANELFQAIDNSKLSTELKNEAETSTNMMINSSIYWKQKNSEQ